MREYTELQKKFRKENLKLWEEKLLEIFNNQIPVRCEWNNTLQIREIINKIGIDGLNHMFYPSGGGLDITGCEISSQRDALIEILTGIPNVCYPRRLVFDSICGEIEWSYFRLELNELEPSGLYSDKMEFDEEVYENFTGELMPYSDYEPNESCRHIVRLLKGTVLIVPKMCYYNNIPYTYDGRHNKYNHDIFRTIMESYRSSEDYQNFMKSMT